MHQLTKDEHQATESSVALSVVALWYSRILGLSPGPGTSSTPISLAAASSHLGDSGDAASAEELSGTRKSLKTHPSTRFPATSICTKNHFSAGERSRGSRSTFLGRFPSTWLWVFGCCLIRSELATTRNLDIALSSPRGL